MSDPIPPELTNIRDLLRFAVSRFNEAHLFFGHGAHDAYDEAAYLILHSLHLPLDRLEPFLDARLTRVEIATGEGLVLVGIGDFVTQALQRDPATSLSTNARYSAAISSRGNDACT